MDHCVICCGSLKDKCDVCQPDKQVQVNSISLLCNPIKHVFHQCCIDAWTAKKNICPLCCNDWKCVEVLTLKELCTIKLLRNTEVLFKLLTMEMSEEIYGYLDKYTKVNMRIDTQIKSKTAKHVAAKYFSQFLTLQDAKTLYDIKGKN